MLRRLLIGVATLAILTGPALAQGRKPQEPPKTDPDALLKQRDREALDKQYKDTLRRTDSDAAPVKVDPWANMRGNDPKR